MVFFAVSKGSGVMDYVLAFKEESSTHRSISSSSITTSVVDGTSPDSVKGKKSTISIFTLYSSIYLLLLLSVFISFCLSSAPPRFLPISSTPQPDRHMAPHRRHSIEKETPTSVRPFIPPSRQSSRSLVRCSTRSRHVHTDYVIYVISEKVMS